MDDIACIVTATLDRARGEKVCREGVALAGVPASYFVSVDEKREGGCKTADRGWRHAYSLRVPYICYVNDDVKFCKGWLKTLVDALQIDSTYGVAAPGGKCHLGEQSKAKPGMPYGVIPTRTMAFFCVVIRREVMSEIGFLDKSFIHYGCDSDYVLRAWEKGWKCVWVRHLWLVHKKGKIIKKWKKKDVARFKRKWPAS